MRNRTTSQYALSLVTVLVALLFAFARSRDSVARADSATAPLVAPLAASDARPESEGLRIPVRGGPRDPVSVSHPREDTAPALAVRVTDAADHPLAAARVAVRAGAVSQEVNATDVAGRSLLSLASAEPFEVVVRASGYALETTLMKAPFPEELHVKLVPAAQIAGRIVLADGSSAGAGITVVAWPADSRTREALIAVRAQNADLGTLASTSASDGSFRLDGVSKDTDYRITAGGLGLMPSGDKGELRGDIQVRAGADDVRLVVFPAYGAELVVLERGSGKSIDLSKEQPGSSVHMVNQDPDARPAAAGSAGAILAGLSVPDEPASFGHLQFLFVTDKPKPSVGPMRYSHAVPGYQPQTITFSIAPLAQGPDNVRTELTPQVHGFGEVQVRLSGLPELDPHERLPVSQAGIVYLHNGAGHVISFTYPTFAERERTLSHVPYGRYTLVFAALNGSLRCPNVGEAPIEIDVGPKPASVELDLSQSGSIHLEIRRPNGELYDGSAELELIPALGRILSPVVNLTNCDCELSALAPGNYTLRLLAPFYMDRRDALDNEQQVEVRSAQETTVVAITPR
jgi:hypothetical protein